MAGKEKIKLIIVDDIAETRENIRKLLQFEPDIEVVGVGRTGREGIEQAKELKPDVILMDINMPDMDGITATETVRKILPYIQIVILSVQNDPNYMRRAMRAGASDFLAKPPALDELTSALRRAGAKAQEEKELSAQVYAASQSTSTGGISGIMLPGRKGKVVSIYSPKGGTGCTTLATNLAIAMHSDENPVCIMDGNLQFGDVAIFMNEQAKYSVIDLAPRVSELDAEVVDSLVMKHAATGVRILAAPHRPVDAENITGEQFKEVLHTLRRFFSYIIVDTVPALTDVTLSVIDESDVIVLLTTQDIPSIKNARLFLDVSDALDISRRRLLFTMNRFDKRIGILPEKIAENFKQEVVCVLPFDDRTVVPAVNRGVPFIIGNKTAPISRTIYELGNLIRQRISELESPEMATADLKGKKK
jgi:pilus assembly protein CpaE